jgi:hypothetical protein
MPPQFGYEFTEIRKTAFSKLHLREGPPNWKPFKHHLAERVARQLHLGQEIVVASVVFVLVVVAAIAKLPPVDWAFQLNDAVKNAWVTSPEFEPPFGHAEELSLAGFARRQRMDLQAEYLPCGEPGPITRC